MISSLLAQIFFSCKKKIKITATLAAILVGTGLLMISVAKVSGFIPIIDALFTASSAVCIKGLIVVDTGKLSTQIHPGRLMK